MCFSSVSYGLRFGQVLQANVCVYKSVFYDFIKFQMLYHIKMGVLRVYFVRVSGFGDAEDLVHESHL
jgi:hypothetical protein